MIEISIRRMDILSCDDLGHQSQERQGVRPPNEVWDADKSESGNCRHGRAGMQPFGSANPSKAIAFCVALYAVAVGGTAQAQVAQAQVAEGQGTWTTKTPVPVGRTEVPGVTVNGRI